MFTEGVYQTCGAAWEYPKGKAGEFRAGHIGKRSFIAVKRLADKQVVIAKFIKRRDAIAILGTKGKLRNLNAEHKRKLNSQKVCVKSRYR